MSIFSRTELLLGPEAIVKLQNSRVAVFGIGGVGGHCVEALARSGVGCIDVIDNDIISESNINRQLYATTKTIGRDKVDVCKERCLEINPDIVINKYKLFFMPDSQDDIDFSVYDYVVDCIDTVTGKLCIIQNAKDANVPVISCMGAGNKLDPTAFEVADISETSVCPLARTMRIECKKRGIKNVKCVFSKEVAIKPRQSDEFVQGRRSVPGSTAFVPSVAGLIIAGEVIKDLTSN